MQRRSLLKLGLGGGVVLALGGVGLALRGPTRSRDVPTDLRQLDARQYLTLAAVAARVCPAHPGAPTTDDVAVAVKLDRLFDTMHAGDVKDIKQLLDVLDNALGGLLLEGRFNTFTGSSATQQDATLRSWRTSGLTLKRTGYKAIVGLCAATYYADPTTYHSVGYPGPPNYGNVKSAEKGGDA